MKLENSQVETIVNVAKSYLDHPYEKDFTCLDFVRVVYQNSGIEFPLVLAYAPPPHSINVDSKELANPPIGHILFLRRKETKTK
jgi:hypothetical protein